MKTRFLSVLFKSLLSAALVCLTLALAVRAYEFGRAVFDEEPGTAENPQTVTVEVREGESIGQVAGELEDAGLIESRFVFIVQKYFYGNDLVVGTYTLDFNMTGKDILDILSGMAVNAGDDS